MSLTLEPEKFVWYRCEHWDAPPPIDEDGEEEEEVWGHGGDIDLTSRILSDTKNEVFRDVTETERDVGLVDYRKIYFRNENERGYRDIRGFIRENTPAINDDIAICAAGTRSRVGVATPLSGTATFTAGSTTIATSADLRGEIVPGELVFNADDDDQDGAVTVAVVLAGSIALVEPYHGTGGSGRLIAVAGLDRCTYVQPASGDHEDALVIGTLGQDEAAAIVIRRTVTGGLALGYARNTFTLQMKGN